ncbi:MAG TPA: acetylxylan esterase [Phycisphaerae bacterium]|nr:acetylxylan esterase [Phycisphaerae bacterium]
MKRTATLFVFASLLAACATADVGRSPAPLPQTTAPSPRADFLKLIDRPKVDVNVKLQTPAVTGTLEQTAFSFDAEKGQTVPGILLKAANSTGKRPVVIYLHGTGGKKEDGLPLMRNMANRGFLGVSIDGRYHGARAAAFPKEGNMNAYETAIFHTWKIVVDDQLPPGEKKQHPLYYDTVWDIMRLIDYLQTRDDVDAAHIGLYGVSKGGIEAYLAAAVDTRIAACVPCISVESFKWAVDNNQWKARVETFQKAFDAAAKEAGITTPDGKFVSDFYQRVMPGIDGEFDGPSMVPLIAPRALMAINGEKDPRTQPPSLKLATDAAQAAYKAAGAEDRFVIMIQPNTPHQVKPDAQRAGEDFLAKWLKP